MNEQIKTMESATQPSPAADGGKEKFNFIKWVRGKNTQEFLENGSYVLMVVAAILVSLGLLVGSFVPGVVIVASVGAFILLPGLVIYVVSQLMLPDENKEGENK